MQMGKITYTATEAKRGVIQWDKAASVCDISFTAGDQYAILSYAENKQSNIDVVAGREHTGGPDLSYIAVNKEKINLFLALVSV